MKNKHYKKSDIRRVMLKYWTKALAPYPNNCRKRQEYFNHKIENELMDDLEKLSHDNDDASERLLRRFGMN